MLTMLSLALAACTVMASPKNTCYTMLGKLVFFQQNTVSYQKLNGGGGNADNAFSSIETSLFLKKGKA